MLLVQRLHAVRHRRHAQRQRLQRRHVPTQRRNTAPAATGAARAPGTEHLHGTVPQPAPLLAQLVPLASRQPRGSVAPLAGGAVRAGPEAPGACAAPCAARVRAEERGAQRRHPAAGVRGGRGGVGAVGGAGAGGRRRWGRRPRAAAVQCPRPGVRVRVRRAVSRVARTAVAAELAAEEHRGHLDVVLFVCVHWQRHLCAFYLCV